MTTINAVQEEDSDHCLPQQPLAQESRPSIQEEDGDHRLPRQPRVQESRPGKTEESILLYSPDTTIKESSHLAFVQQRSHSFWLRRATLFGLCALFTVAWISLLVLWRYNRSLNGFPLTVSSNHLTWTYGPTAILVVIVSFWRQVDYHCKSTQAWRDMRKGFGSARNTVLLDYIWPLQISSFVLATRNRHYLVASSILGFALLKITTVVSTGLFVSSDVNLLRTTTATLQTAFDGSKFWTNDLQGDLNETESSPHPGVYDPPDSITIDPPDAITMGPLDTITIGPQPAYKNISNQFIRNYLRSLQDYSLRIPSIVNTNAIQSFSTAPEDGLISATAAVDVFVPHADCEAANITILPCTNLNIALKITSPSCPSHQANKKARDTLSEGIDVESASSYHLCGLAPNPPIYVTGRVDCAVSESPAPGSSQTSDITTSADLRIVAAIMDISSVKHYSDAGKTSFTRNKTFHGATAVIYKLGYHIQKATVSTRQGVFSILSLSGEPAADKHLKDLTEQQLTEILWSSISRSPEYSRFLRYDNVLLFKIMKEFLNMTSGLDAELNEQNMKESLSATLTGMSSNFMAQLYSAPVDLHIDAVGMFSEQRLRIEMAALATIVSALIVMSLLASIIGLLTGRSENLADRETWTGHARVLAASEELRKLLGPMSSVSMSMMKQILQLSRFGTVQCNFICVKAADSISTQMPKSQARDKSWIPLAAKWYMLIVTFAFPVIAIIILESLWQISMRNDGVLSIDDIDSTKVSAIRYASTTCALFIATIFNNLDFAVAVLTPFSALLSSRASIRLFPHHSLVGHMPPIALYNALISGQYGASLLMIATTVGSVLTIITSGLWVSGNSLTTHEVRISRRSLWDLNWNASAGDARAAWRFDKLQRGALDPSINIWNDFVLPDLVNLEQPNNSSINTTFSVETNHNNFTFLLPALRPQIECEAVDTSAISAQFHDLGELSASIDLRDACSPGASINRTLKLSSPSTGDFYGDFAELGFSDRSYSTFTNDSANITLNRPGCPSFTLFSSAYKDRDTSEEEIIDNAVLLVCYQRLQQVPLTATFIGDPSQMLLSDASTPVPDKQNATYLQNQTSTSTYFQYPIVENLRRSIKPFLTPGEGNAQFLEPLLNLLLFGPNGIGLDALRPPVNQGALINATERLFASYMLELIDINFRNPVRTSGASNGINDTEIRYPSQSTMISGTMTTSALRLKIDKTSKLTLQIMLGTIVVLGASAVALVDMHGVLPRNPCSIASTMALLADSRLLERMKGDGVAPDGTKCSSDEEGRREIDDEQGVSLGWWYTTTTPTPTVEDEEVPTRESDEREEALGDDRHREMRFGIDLGTADVLGFDRKKSWLTRWRKNKKE